MKKIKQTKEMALVPRELIESRIFLIQGKKVILDKDLAYLYGVKTKELNRAVKRNIERFPDDFMFQLNKEEFENLRFHFGTSSYGGRRYLPYAFTELGVAMLSSVLNSRQAINVNIQIMRAFVKLRELLSSNSNLRAKIELLERKYDNKFKIVFDAIREIQEAKKKDIKRIREIGFKC